MIARDLQSGEAGRIINRVSYNVHAHGRFFARNLDLHPSTTPSVNTHHKEDVASRQLPMPNVRQTALNAPPMPRRPFRSHGRIPTRPRLIIAARPR